MEHPIHVVQLELKPAPFSAAAEAATGANANVFVQAINERAAIAQARSEVESAGWLVEKVVMSKLMTPESFASEDGLQYYRQCEIDGVVIVLHTWRNEH